MERTEPTGGQPVALVAEGPAGLVYHEPALAAWTVELTPRGLLLSFTEAEFRHVLALARRALGHPAVHALLDGDGDGDEAPVRDRAA